MKCPLCGGQVERVEISSAAGVRRFSTCCDVSLDIVDNYDEVFRALPPHLQQAALERDRAERRAIVEREKAAAERFRARRQRA